jgi:hypothetical protein
LAIGAAVVALSSGESAPVTVVGLIGPTDVCDSAGGPPPTALGGASGIALAESTSPSRMVPRETGAKPARLLVDAAFDESGAVTLRGSTGPSSDAPSGECQVLAIGL